MKKPKKILPAKKQEPVYKSYLYLIPEDVSARALLEKLDFFPEEALEIWPSINILEITIENDRTIILESLTEDLYEEDLEILSKMGIRQVYLFEYAEEDAAIMQKIMKLYLESFGGKIGSDTDDFSPYVEAESL